MASKARDAYTSKVLFVELRPCHSGLDIILDLCFSLAAVDRWRESLFDVLL
jgi:hypothetical protein